MNISELKIGVIGGTGEEGRGLALRWAMAGAQVRIGSRTTERARAAADGLNVFVMNNPIGYGGWRCLSSTRHNEIPGCCINFILSLWDTLFITFEEIDSVVDARELGHTGIAHEHLHADDAGGPQLVERRIGGDRAAPQRDVNARLLQYRGDMTKEYAAYGSDTKEILTAFTDGINVFIRDCRSCCPFDTSPRVCMRRAFSSALSPPCNPLTSSASAETFCCIACCCSCKPPS